MPNVESLAEIVVLTVKATIAPLLERLAAAEAKAERVDEAEHAVALLRDRIVALESQAAHDPLALEKALSGLRERLAVVETRQPIQGPAGKDGLDGKDGADGLGWDPLAHEQALSALRERLAVVETRQPIPGPAGQDGKDGKDGQHGKDGADGLGWDDTAIEHDGERTFTIKLSRGDRTKGGGSFTLPVDIYRGVYVEGRTYDRGDGVTYGGSEWHCNETTTAKPGDGSKAWTLKVKRGRDGKDGRDAPAIPVVSVGR